MARGRLSTVKSHEHGFADLQTAATVHLPADSCEWARRPRLSVPNVEMVSLSVGMVEASDNDGILQEDVVEMRALFVQSCRREFWHERSRFTIGRPMPTVCTFDVLSSDVIRFAVSLQCAVRSTCTRMCQPNQCAAVLWARGGCHSIPHGALAVGDED